MTELDGAWVDLDSSLPGAEAARPHRVTRRDRDEVDVSAVHS